MSPAISAKAAAVARERAPAPAGIYGPRVRPSEAAQLRAAAAVIVRKPAKTPMPNEVQTVIVVISCCANQDRGSPIGIERTADCPAHEDGKQRYKAGP